MKVKYSQSNGTGSIAAAGATWQLIAPPVVTFPFSDIDYDSEENVALITTDGTQSAMREDWKQELENWAAQQTPPRISVPPAIKGNDNE